MFMDNFYNYDIQMVGVGERYDILKVRGFLNTFFEFRVLSSSLTDITKTGGEIAAKS